MNATPASRASLTIGRACLRACRDHVGVKILSHSSLAINRTFRYGLGCVLINHAKGNCAVGVGTMTNQEVETITRTCWRGVAWRGRLAEVFAEFDELSQAMGYVRERAERCYQCFLVSHAPQDGP
jgi:hypothetical protein